MSPIVSPCWLLQAAPLQGGEVTLAEFQRVVLEDSSRDSWDGWGSGRLGLEAYQQTGSPARGNLQALHRKLNAHG